MLNNLIFTIKFLLKNYRKLTIPFAINKNAGIHKKTEETDMNIENIKTMEANRSITLNGSPLKINRPFSSNTPEQNKVI